MKPLRRWARAALELVAAAALLAGCASAPQEDSAQVRTASDLTEGERRARVRLELASAYFSRGQYATALDEVKQALASNPNYGDAYNLRGLVYGAMGEHALAEESYRKALQINPRDADALHNYAWWLCQQRRFAQAENHFNQALAQPQYRDIKRSWLALGVCQARDGKLPQSEASLMHAFEMDPADPAVAFNLSEVLLRRDDLERARFYIARVNNQREYSSAQTLWLALRIERRAGKRAAMQDLARQLRDRFPQSPELARFEAGQFDD